jgi:hypothetical protein
VWLLIFIQSNDLVLPEGCHIGTLWRGKHRVSTNLEFPIGQRVQALWMTIHREHRRNGVHGAAADFTAFEKRAFDRMDR